MVKKKTEGKRCFKDHFGIDLIDSYNASRSFKQYIPDRVRLTFLDRFGIFVKDKRKAKSMIHRLLQSNSSQLILSCERDGNEMLSHFVFFFLESSFKGILGDPHSSDTDTLNEAEILSLV